MLYKTHIEEPLPCLFCETDSNEVISSVLLYEEFGLPSIVVEQDELSGHIYATPYCPKHEDACTHLVLKRSDTWAKEVTAGRWNQVPNIYIQYN